MTIGRCEQSPLRLGLCLVGSLAVNAIIPWFLSRSSPSLETEAGRPTLVEAPRLRPPSPPPQPDPSPQPRTPSIVKNLPSGTLDPPILPSPLVERLQSLSPMPDRLALLAFEADTTMPGFEATDGDSDLRTAEEALTLKPPQLRFRPNVDTFYPQEASRRNLGGRSVVEVEVGIDGQPRSLRILESRPPRVFDEAARAAVSQMRWRPATRGGRAEAASAIIQINWLKREDEP